MTPDRIKAFLDDLARLSIKDGLWIDAVEGARIDEIEPEQGYSFKSTGWPWLTLDDECDDADIHSFDVTQLSAHELFAIMGNRSPDLAQMLRDAFMAGVESTGQGWNGEHPGDAESRAEFGEEAADYAAKIMGG